LRNLDGGIAGGRERKKKEMSVSDVEGRGRGKLAFAAVQVGIPFSCHPR
jgi:hypothetical protein